MIHFDEDLNIQYMKSKGNKSVSLTSCCANIHKLYGYLLAFFFLSLPMCLSAQDKMHELLDSASLEYIQSDDSLFKATSLLVETRDFMAKKEYTKAQETSDSALSVCPKEGINALIVLPTALYISGYCRIKRNNLAEGRQLAAYGQNIWWNIIQNDNLHFMYKPIRDNMLRITDMLKIKDTSDNDSTNYAISFLRSEGLRIWLRVTEKMDSLELLSTNEGILSEEFELNILEFIFETGDPNRRGDPKLLLSTVNHYLSLLEEKKGKIHSKYYTLILESMLLCCASHETIEEARPIYLAYKNDDSLEKQYKDKLLEFYEGIKIGPKEEDETLTESIDPLEDQRQMDIFMARVNRVMARARTTFAIYSNNTKELLECDSLMQKSIQSLSEYHDSQTLKESVRLLTELSCFRIRYYKEMGMSIAEAANTFNEIFPFLNKCFNNQVSKEHAALFYADMHLMADAKKWDQVVSIGEKLKDLYQVWNQLPTVKVVEKNENVFGDRYNYPIVIPPLADVNKLLVNAYLNYKGEKDYAKMEETYASFINESKQKVINDVKSNKFLYNTINVLLRNSVYLSKQLDANSLKNAAFENAILLKGLKFYSSNLVKLMVAQGDNNTDNDTYERYTKLNRLVLEDSQESKEYTDSITKELKVAEILLYANSAKYGDFIKSLSTTIDDIDKQLPEKSCIVEFVDYTENKQTNLVALLKIKGDKNIKFVNLGTLEIPKDITNLYSNEYLYRKIWEPIILSIPSYTKFIYFSPIGVISTIGIENAKDADGQFLSDKYKIYRLTNSREVLKTQKVYNNPYTHIVLYGDIDYGGSDCGTNEVCSTQFKGQSLMKTREALVRGSIKGIEPLEGTKKELNNISEVLKANSIPCIVYSGTTATEASFSSLSGTDVSQIHIATHGYFDGSNEVINVDKMDLRDSGLLLAGAENTINGLNDITVSFSNDGILKAGEIANMNFPNLDLVTLSACETALGHISSEGVFGLQRGFKIAGANSILMSLWKVDDEATCKLMTEFYSNWIGKKMTKHDALEAAKKTVRETKGWEDPRYWAAFILLDGLD